MLEVMAILTFIILLILFIYLLRNVRLERNILSTINKLTIVFLSKLSHNHGIASLYTPLYGLRYGLFGHHRGVCKIYMYA